MSANPIPVRSIDLVRELARRHTEQQREDAKDPEATRRRKADWREKARAAAVAEFEEATGRHLAACGLSEREARLVQHGSTDWRAHKAAQAFWKDPDQKFLVLAGVVGTGKTVAAAALFLKLRWHISDPDLGDLPLWMLDGAYRLAGELADRKPFDVATSRDTGVLERRRLVVVDELGCEKAMSAPWLSTFDGLIDARYRASARKTILCTNVSIHPPKQGDRIVGPAPFRERYGDRVWRRLKECGRFVSLGCAECARSSDNCPAHRKEVP